jgi:ferrous iron transport protein A
MTLNDISPGQGCRVKALKIGGNLGQRLMDLGFFPGVEVEVIRNAPLMDPVEVKMVGYHVSIRHSEAAFVEVE